MKNIMFATVVAFGMVVMCGCSTATPASRATTATYTFNFNFGEKAKNVNIENKTGDSAIASADSSGSTETQTATPTVDVKPDIDVKYNDSIASASAASKSVSPFTRITPVSGRSRKFRQRSSVVFPLPEEPMIESTSPFSSEKPISRSTCAPPKCLPMFSASRIAMVLRSLHLK